MSGQTPGGITWSTVRITSTSTPTRSMIPLGISSRASVWLVSGERLRGPLKTTALRSSYLVGASSACLSMKLWMFSGIGIRFRSYSGAGRYRLGARSLDRQFLPPLLALLARLLRLLLLALLQRRCALAGRAGGRRVGGRRIGRRLVGTLDLEGADIGAVDRIRDREEVAGTAQAALIDSGRGLGGVASRVDHRAAGLERDRVGHAPVRGERCIEQRVRGRVSRAGKAAAADVPNRRRVVVRIALRGEGTPALVA